MKFVDKQLALKLKEKGYDRPCFGYYYIETLTGMNDGELVLNRYPCRGGTYEDTLERHIDFQPKEGFVGYINPNVVDTPTIDQVLEWLREDCGLYIAMVCSRDFDIDADGRELGSWVYWWYEIYAHLSADLIYQEEEKEYETYDEAILAGIEYVVEHLI
jgi:hypothetical protein